MTSAPTFKQIFHGIWNMSSELLRRGPGFLVTAFVIMTAVEWMKALLPAETLADKALREFAYSAGYVLLAPVEFAAYRLLILDVRTINLQSRRFLRFLAWYAVAQFALFVPTIMSEAEFNVFAEIPTWIVLLIPTIYVFLRLPLLLPSLAASVERVSFADAWNDTRGNLWTVVKVVLGTVVPLLVVVLILMAFIALAETLIDDDHILIWRVLTEPFWTAVVQMLGFVPLVAAFAFLYMKIGDRVKRRP